MNQLHAALLRNVDTHAVQDQFGHVFEQPLDKGTYKTAPNSPTRPDGSLHQYSPPEHSAAEMDALIRMHLEHEAGKVPTEVAAAWLHHRFTQIHPFADGNGRVARALASVVFMRAGWFPLVVKRDARGRYIDALEKADAGDLGPLIVFFVHVQRDILVAASEVGYDSRPITSTHDAVLAVRDRLLQRVTRSLTEWPLAKEVAAHLVNQATKRLGEVASELDTEIAGFGDVRAFSAGSGDSRDPSRTQAIQQSGQVAAYSDFSDRVFLRLQAGVPAELNLSFHALGPAFRGLIGVLAYLTIQGTQPALIEGGTFLINYEEEFASASSRFSLWLDRVIVNGLNSWRLTL